MPYFCGLKVPVRAMEVSNRSKMDLQQLPYDLYQFQAGVRLECTPTPGMAQMADVSGSQRSPKRGVRVSLLLLPPPKWTNVPWRGIILKGHFIFQPSIFRGYVSFEGGISFCLQKSSGNEMHPDSPIMEVENSSWRSRHFFHVDCWMKGKEI